MTPPLNSKQETLLHHLYFDQGIRLGRDKLYQASIAASPTEHPSPRQVQAWLFQQEEYQLDLPTRQTKSIRPFFAAHPYESLQVDLIDFTNKPSRQYRYILVAIDVFSRYVWAFPLTGKNVAATTRALEKLLEECEKKPRLISHDHGSEFQGSFEALLRQRGIKSINGIPSRPESNGVVERVNGTLKKLILRNKAYKGLGWSDHLEEAVDNYNSLPHVTLGISPAEAIALPAAEQEELATHTSGTTRQTRYRDCRWVTE
jgi:transposase InsO family protein